jgi:hypothetical protein
MRKTIIANQGFILTNGETYAKIVDLAENENASNWYEITDKEYQEILKKEEEESPNGNFEN